MSTYLYLECKDHDPPLTSNGEVGQHTYDLDDIRRLLLQREAIVNLMNSDAPMDWDSQFSSNAAWFLKSHPKCNIEIGRAHV